MCWEWGRAREESLGSRREGRARRYSRVGRTGLAAWRFRCAENRPRLQKGAELCSCVSVCVMARESVGCYNDLAPRAESHGSEK